MQLKTRSSLKFPLFFLFSFSLLKLVTLYFSWRWKGKAFPLPHYCWGTASAGISDFPPRKAPGSWLAFQGPEWLSLLRDSKYSVLQHLPSYQCFQDQAYQIHKYGRKSVKSWLCFCSWANISILYFLWFKIREVYRHGCKHGLQTRGYLKTCSKRKSAQHLQYTGLWLNHHWAAGFSLWINIAFIFTVLILNRRNKLTHF